MRYRAGPATGSIHHAGWIEYMVTSATGSATESDQRPGRRTEVATGRPPRRPVKRGAISMNATQTTAGITAKRPVNFVAAASPSAKPNGTPHQRDSRLATKATCASSQRQVIGMS